MTSKSYPKTMQILAVILLAVLVSASSSAETDADNTGLFDRYPPLEIHGFTETRAGYRIQDDEYEHSESVLEARFQLELFTYCDWLELKHKGSVWADGILEKGKYDTREAWIFTRPTDSLDIKIGRQILTWGTGDLVFLNDLFPKDWQSYFIGRDNEYLKAPSDAVKVSLFTDLINLDVVYSPKFDPDRYITGEYISYWKQDQFAGQNHCVRAEIPHRWFRDDEIAVRLYQNIQNYEFALYGYHGFWKQPGGERDSGVSFFPTLTVYGASARGQTGQGIGNIEIAYYLSSDDKDGANPNIKNSEIRFLVGYARELAKNLTGSIQYYLEYMIDYDNYKTSHSSAGARDHDRHVITIQLTQLLLNQNLEISLSSYLSPSDRDGYIRPMARYKCNDMVIIEGGANIFIGKENHTFFGQFENNSNVYAAVRYSF